MTNVGKYRIEAELGRGGMGRVYRAFDPDVGRRVAIKLLLSESETDLLKRFRQEASTAGTLAHKNIVTVYDYGEHESSPFLVMEYLEGEDLHKVLKTGKPLSLLEKTLIMGQVADGLLHAHRHGIVHRDVKPANIMILADGTVKIMDFGIARVLRSTRLTQTPSLIGTLDYMAPEAFQQGDTNHLADIFSYGVLFYQLIAGSNPFTAEDAVRVIYKVTTSVPPSVDTLVQDCPPSLAQLISRALEKDRNLRYQSFEDLLFDLMPIRQQLQAEEAQHLIEGAKAMLSADRVAEAQEVVRKVLELDPQNEAARRFREKIAARKQSDGLLTLGREQFSSHKFSLALKSLESALRVDPERTEVLQLLDEVKTALQKEEKAAALIVQAKIDLQVNNLKAAYKSILECLQYAPDNKEADGLLKTIRARIEQADRQRRLDEGLEKATDLLASDKLEEAESLLSELEINYPADTRVKELEADVQVAIHEKKRRRYLADSLSTARAAIDSRKWSDAISLVSRLAQEFPGDADVHLLAAAAQEGQEAQRKADRIKRVQRDALAANEAQDFDRALKIIHEGLGSYPAEPALTKLLESTTALHDEHERDAAIQAATRKAAMLSAGRQFAPAIAEIDSVLSKWKSDELQQLRNRLDGERAQYERQQAISARAAAINSLLGKSDFEGAVALCKDALAAFSGEPSLMTLEKTAQAGLEEQRRKARIAAICEEAAAKARGNQFEDALQILEGALRDSPRETSLLALRERVRADKNRREVERAGQERQQAISERAAAIKSLMDKSNFEEALALAKDALAAFSGESALVALERAAQAGLEEQRRKARIAAICEDAAAKSRSSQFDAALQTIEGGLRDFPRDSSLVALRDRVRSDRQGAVQQLAQKSRDMQAAGDLEGALQLLEKGLVEHPGESALTKRVAELRALQAKEKQPSENMTVIAPHKKQKRIGDIAAQSQRLIDEEKLEEALSVLKSALQEFPNDPELTAQFAYTNEVLSARQRTDAVRKIAKEAKTLLKKEEAGPAEELLRTAITQYPGEESLAALLETARLKVTTAQKLPAPAGDDASDKTVMTALPKAAAPAPPAPPPPVVDDQKTVMAPKTLVPSAPPAVPSSAVDDQKTVMAPKTSVPTPSQKPQERKVERETPVAAAPPPAPPAAPVVPPAPVEEPAKKTAPAAKTPAPAPSQKPQERKVETPAAAAPPPAPVVPPAPVQEPAKKPAAAAKASAPAPSQKPQESKVERETPAAAVAPAQPALAQAAPKRSNTIAIVGGIAAAAVLAAGIYIGTRPSEPAGEATPAAVAGAPASPTTDAQNPTPSVQNPAPQQTASPVASNSVNPPPPPANPVATPTASQPAPKPAATGGAAAAPDRNVPPSPTSAAVTIRASEKGANVLIDGQRVGTTDAPITTNLKAGNHKVVVEKNGFEDAERDISVVAGKEQDQAFNLVPKPTRLALGAAPAGIRILVDNTVSSGDVNVAPGPHTIVLQQAGFTNKTFTVDVPQGEIKKLDPGQFAMEKTPAAPPVVASPPPTAPAVARGTPAPAPADNSAAEAAAATARAEETEWRAVDKDSKSKLVAFKARFPKGNYADDADKAIQRIDKDVAAIQSRLKQFETGFKNKSTKELKVVFPTLDKSFIDTFDGPNKVSEVTSATLKSRSEPTLQGNTAVVVCDFDYAVKNRGQSVSLKLQVTVGFAREGDNWNIKSWTAKARS